MSMRSPTPRFGPPPMFGGPRFGGPDHGYGPRGPGLNLFGERLGFNYRHSMPGQGAGSYDGKKLRTKPMIRRTVDYNSSMTNYMKNRIWQKDHRDSVAIQPDALHSTYVTPPLSLPEHPMNCVCTKHVRNASNKIKCPIFCVVWTPEGRRLITGASSGEFTLWNGMTFSFETILQAHDTSVRAMVWDHSGHWMVTGEHAGFVKYWQNNMNNVKMYQAHKDAVRGISFCPTDAKFATCSDDGTVRVWDFLRCHEERILRGHGADVKCVDWHPQKGLIASGSRDNQQPIIMWDPRQGTKLSTIHAHKSTVMEVKWNANGNWLLTASRDHLVKLFDVRNMKEEMQAFKGHRKEATTIAWNPIHESLFASGGSDGQILYWMVGQDREVGCINDAHETMVWSLAWHPMGHILVSGSNDHSSKFWTRNRPGDGMRDRYNLNLLPMGVTEDMLEYDDLSAGCSIPGMGLEYMPQGTTGAAATSAAGAGDKKQQLAPAAPTMAIPGLDFSVSDAPDDDFIERRKRPFAKPVPNDFQRAWTEGKQPDNMHLDRHEGKHSGGRGSHHGFKTPGPHNRPPNQGPNRWSPSHRDGGGRDSGGRDDRGRDGGGRDGGGRDGGSSYSRKEANSLPGMGGPLPGPDHQPTLHQSRARYPSDRPLTSSNASPHNSQSPGGLLGDRPPSRGHSPAGGGSRRSPSSQNSHRSSGGGGGGHLYASSTPGDDVFYNENKSFDSDSGNLSQSNSLHSNHGSGYKGSSSYGAGSGSGGSHNSDASFGRSSQNNDTSFNRSRSDYSSEGSVSYGRPSVSRSASRGRGGSGGDRGWGRGAPRGGRSQMGSRGRGGQKRSFEDGPGNGYDDGGRGGGRGGMRGGRGRGRGGPRGRRS